MVGFKSSLTRSKVKKKNEKICKIMHILFKYEIKKIIVIFMCMGYSNNIESLYLLDISVTKKTNYSAYFKTKT